MNKILIIAVVLLIVSSLLFAIFRKPRSTELGTLTFEELCKGNGDQWMEMEGTKKGKPISEEMCFGCMIADNHFCDVNGYIEYVKNLPYFVR